MKYYQNINCLQTPDGVVSLAHWYALLKVENERAFNLKINFKLTEGHLNPAFYKKMNVALAFQVRIFHNRIH